MVKAHNRKTCELENHGWIKDLIAIIAIAPQARDDDDGSCLSDTFYALQMLGELYESQGCRQSVGELAQGIV